MTTKEALYRLIDELPESELHTAEAFLEFLRSRSGTIQTPPQSESDDSVHPLDPVEAAFLRAPYDDEPLTADDIAAIEEGWAEAARGETVPWDEVRARLFPDAK